MSPRHRSISIHFPLLPHPRHRRLAGTPLILLCCTLLGSCGGSTGGAQGEAADIARAQRLAVADSAPGWPAADARMPVLLYVDRSGSMRGFLDSSYARQPTDYRSVIDGFDARLTPSLVFGFGNEVREAGRGLGVLGDKAFYSDGNTQLEEVFPRVRADSGLASSHVIIGDGRRGNPNAANGQYVEMRRVADQWIARGGTFIVAASLAPFRPVRDDPAGCRGSGADTVQTCPLYAFAFVAPGDQGRVAETLAAVFEHLYVTPLPALPGSAVRLTARPSGDITLESLWAVAPRGMPVSRVRSLVATNTPLSATLVLRDSTSPRGKAALKALRGRRLVPALAARSLSDDTAAAWNPSGASALMRPGGDPFTWNFVSYGQNAQRTLYRLDLHPAGEPSWLDAFTAQRATDARRTYGLGSLFEGFSARDPLSAPAVIRSYTAVN